MSGLADFKAVLDRLTSFDEAIARAQRVISHEHGIHLTASKSPDLSIDNLELDLPDGRQLARIKTFAFAAHEPTLLIGPSGAGKSTLLRAVAGVWPYGSGTIAKPKASLMLLPQRPYIPIGALRDAIAYPQRSKWYRTKPSGRRCSRSACRRSPTNSTARQLADAAFGRRAATRSGRPRAAGCPTGCFSTKRRPRSTRRAKRRSIARSPTPCRGRRSSRSATARRSDRSTTAASRSRRTSTRRRPWRRSKGQSLRRFARNRRMDLPSAQSERTRRREPRGPLITSSPLTRSHAGWSSRADRKPNSIAIVSLSHCFLVKA